MSKEDYIKGYEEGQIAADKVLKAQLDIALEALREIEALAAKSENELYSVNSGERLANLTVKCRDMAAAMLAKIAAILGGGMYERNKL